MPARTRCDSVHKDSFLSLIHIQMCIRDRGMKQQLKQLEEFHRALGLYINEQPTLRIPQDLHELRMRGMKEEVDEYAEEYAITGDTEDERLQAVAKELADIAYTLLGTVV